MGCCSGNETAKKNINDPHSAEPKPKIHLGNYTYFPGAIRQTDYTNSTLRTGWASESDRKRNIAQTIYYKPSHSVIANYGRDGSSLLEEMSSIFAPSSRALLKGTGKNVGHRGSSSNAESIKFGGKTKDSEYKKTNYFGKQNLI